MLQRLSRTAMAVALAAAWVDAGCTDVAATRAAETPAPGTGWVVLVDDSQSVCAAGSQAEFWTDAVEQLVFSHVTRGDTLAIYRLGSGSAFDPPVFEGRMPGVAAGFVGGDAEMKARLDTKRVKTAGMAAFKALVGHCSRTRWSRLVDGLDRLPASHLDRARVVIFSDGMESAPDLDLERFALTLTTAEELAGRTLARPGWGPTRLEGARIRFVLPRYDGVDRAGADKRTLEAFWRRVVESAGARLLSFDNALLDSDDGHES